MIGLKASIARHSTTAFARPYSTCERMVRADTGRCESRVVVIVAAAVVTGTAATDPRQDTAASEKQQVGCARPATSVGPTIQGSCAQQLRVRVTRTEAATDVGDAELVVPWLTLVRLLARVLLPRVRWTLCWMVRARLMVLLCGVVIVVDAVVG